MQFAKQTKILTVFSYYKVMSEANSFDQLKIKHQLSQAITHSGYI